jgi:hypothetical protein
MQILGPLKGEIRMVRDKQVVKLMDELERGELLGRAAFRSGMNPKTARVGGEGREGRRKGEKGETHGEYERGQDGSA